MDSAGIPWYSTGTVNVTQGSSNVAGVGTNWVNAGLKVGDIFTIDKSRLYQITAINSNTSLSLQEAYQGATGSSQVYFVIRNFAGTMQAQIAAQVSELVNKYESYIDTELKQITGPAGPTSFPYRGTWTTGRTYNGLDVVQYGKQLYMALYGHTSTSANAPGATGTAWTQLTFDAAFSATEAAISAIANTGAKNVLYIKELPTQVVDGIEYKVNADGTIYGNGTKTADITNGPSFASGNFLPGEYILSGNKKIDSFVFRIGKQPGNVFVASGADNVRFNVEDNVTYNFSLFNNTPQGTKIQNEILAQPMLRNASITDTTYVPYGMTNAELTNDSGFIEAASDILPGISYRKKGYHVFLRIYDASPTRTMNSGNNVLFVLPEGFRPPGTFCFIAILLKNNIIQNALLIVSPNGQVILNTLINGVDSSYRVSCAVSYLI